MKRTKRLLVIMMSVCMIVTMCPFVQSGLTGGGSAYAASKGTADAMVSFADQCAGKSKSTLGLSGEWCARFVYYCAKNSGNSGKIGSGTYVGTQAEQTVNSKGGTITFVNKAAYKACKGRFNVNRCKYDASYIPKKGDLYIQKGEDLGDQYFAHIGIVRKNSTKKSVIYTIEGNTSCSDGKHTNYQYVEYKTRDNDSMKAPYGFSAFITPDYDVPAVSHKISYTLNGGSGSFSSFSVKDGGSFSLSGSKPSREGYTFKGWYAKRLADSKWFVDGKSWCTWDYITANKLTPKTYNPGQSYTLDSSWTKGSPESNYGFYAQWKANTWTVKYSANGGSGTMADTKHTYGEKTYIRKNTFTLSGYAFDGWNAYRPNLDKWLYTNGNQENWYKRDSQPAGYYLKTYDDATWVKATTPVNNDTVVFYAKWKKTESKPEGNPDQGSGSFTRYAGTDRYKTSMIAADALKSSLGVSRFDNIIVASGADYPDALAGSYLAKVKSAPVLLTGTDANSEAAVKQYISTNLNSGGTVYILGGTGVVTSRFESSLSNVNVRRLGGSSRYETNIEILQAAGAGNEDLLVCTGEGFADSLSVSAVGKPILLSAKSGLNYTQQAYLDSLNINDIYLIGGSGVVTDYTGQQLDRYDDDGRCERIAGQNRYLTSVAVAKKFFPDGAGSVVLAYAQNFPDGLAGGPLALSLDSPLLLVDQSGYNDAAAFARSMGIKKAVVLGGPTLIPDSVVNRIVN